MSASLLWLTIVLAGVITYALRGSFIALIDRLTLPATVQRGLRFVPVAVFSAIVLPRIVVQQGTIDLSPVNLQIGAAMLAGLVAWRTHNVLYTIIAGMATLWLLKLIAG